MSPTANLEHELIARIVRLEQSNRRMKGLGVAALLLAFAFAAAGFQAGKNRVTADEVVAKIINASAIEVPSERGLLRIDERGITITAPGMSANRTNLKDHETRIEIGMDYEWQQDNGLKPTPRIAVGRAGHDTSDNVVTRASILSPEGVHSGEWHTNNPRHDGRTDRDLIESLLRRDR